MPESKQSFADRLGQWLDFNQALALFSALQAGDTVSRDARPTAPSPEAPEMRQAYERVRHGLIESITGDELFGHGSQGGELPVPAPNETGETPADFAPYHRYCLARQRDMMTSTGRLRASVRAALARHSPALKRLATLDAAFDQALAARERELLATVPSFLARGFEALYNAHRMSLARVQGEDDPACWRQPGGWLDRFCREMHSLLLAELDLRLQPVAGLIAALEMR